MVAAFSLGVHNGGDLPEALRIAKQISAQHDGSFHELESRDLDLAALKEEVVELATSVQRALTNMTDEYTVSRAMANYPKAPYSDLVSSDFPCIRFILGSFYSSRLILSFFSWSLGLWFHSIFILWHCTKDS